MIAYKIEGIRRTALFGSLAKEELRALAERAVERHLAKDEVLFVAGENARGLYVVVKGAVRAVRINAEGREQIIHVEREGATLAEVPVFDEGQYPSTVAADEPSIVLYIDRRDVQRLCLEHPQIALAALKLMASRLRQCAEMVESLSLRDVGQRLARFLLEEARHKGQRTERGIEMQLSQTNQQIAARVGSVREVISRALSRLQQDQLIVLNGRELIVLDEKLLEHYAGGEQVKISRKRSQKDYL